METWYERPCSEHSVTISSGGILMPSTVFLSRCFLFGARFLSAAILLSGAGIAHQALGQGLPCNGMPHLCHRAYNEVAYPTTHNNATPTVAVVQE